MLSVLGRSRNLGPKCHLSSDGNQMLPRRQSQRESKFSGRVRHLDPSSSPGQQAEEMLSALFGLDASPSLPLDLHSEVHPQPVLSTYCMHPSSALGGTWAGWVGRHRERTRDLHLVQAPYLVTDGKQSLGVGGSLWTPLRSPPLSHHGCERMYQHVIVKAYTPSRVLSSVTCQIPPRVFCT